ncbi:hypothetical protein V2J09_008534, partial [Rumex salicifolius]
TVGPGLAPQRRPKRPLQFEQAYLDALPSANIMLGQAREMSKWAISLGRSRAQEKKGHRPKERGE